MAEQLLESVRAKYGAVAESTSVKRSCGREGCRGGLRLYRGGTDFDSSRGQHGPVLRQSHSDGAYPALVRWWSISARRRSGCVSGLKDGRP